MLKKEFIAGMVTGAIAFGGTGAAAGLLTMRKDCKKSFIRKISSPGFMLWQTGFLPVMWKVPLWSGWNFPTGRLFAV